jgi:hypothetical protein
MLVSCHYHQNLKDKHGERKLGLTFFVEGRLSFENQVYNFYIEIFQISIEYY